MVTAAVCTVQSTSRELHGGPEVQMITTANHKTQPQKGQSSNIRAKPKSQQRTLKHNHINLGAGYQQIGPTQCPSC